MTQSIVTRFHFTKVKSQIMHVLTPLQKLMPLQH